MDNQFENNKRRPSRLGLRGVSWLLILAWLCLAAIATGQTTGHETMSLAEEREPASLSDRWGIEIRSLRLTANGHMLDFRYQVIDPEKAAPLLDRKIKPVLIAEKSGHQFGVFESPKTGPLRSSNMPQAGRTYFVFFTNRGMHINTGDDVAIVIGDFKVENLVVE